MINLLTKARWLEKLDPKRGGDLALLSCCVVTGVLDCAAFNNWGVFVGMQTGMPCQLTGTSKPLRYLPTKARKYRYPLSKYRGIPS